MSEDTGLKRIIAKKVARLLKAHDFDCLIWDGQEITVFSETKPFSALEFVPGTETRLAILDLEDVLSSNNVFPFEQEL